MRIECPNCGKALKVPDTAAGKAVKCPGCEEKFTVPAADAGVPAGRPEPSPPEKLPAAKGSSPASSKRSAPADDGGAPPKKSGGRKALKIVGIGCLVVILIAAGATYYVIKSAKGWAADLARTVAVAAIESFGLPDEQQKGIIGHVDRVVDAYKEGKISTEEVVQILQQLAESPLLPLAMVSMANTKYVQSSGLSDEEKEEGDLILQRFARGVVEEKITGNDVNEIVSLISTTTSEGQTQLKEKLTDDEVQELLAAVKGKADAAEIPEEPYEVDPVEEIGKIVDAALEGK